MQAYILKSRTGARFHFGKSPGTFGTGESNALQDTSEYLHSDTLWSALVSVWALCAPETAGHFISECKAGNFKVSSAFYHVEYNDKSVFFLPKPVVLNLYSFDKPKELKRVKMISLGIWQNGLLPEDWFNEEKCTLLQKKSIVALKSEIDKPVELFKVETSPKVRARDITDRDGNFYHQTDLFLLGNNKYRVNWYFVAENHLSENLQNDFESVMKTLVKMGIGGERSSGCGSLTGCDEPVDFQPGIKNTNYRSSLSLVAPNENELTETALYQTMKRGGRSLGKGKSLPMIQMLSEGAVFDTEVKGRIVELSATPPVLRYGLNLAIPLHDNFINGQS